MGGVGIGIMFQHAFERAICAIVHVRRCELHVAQRRNAKREPRERKLRRQTATAQVERSGGADARSDLRYARVLEALTAEQWTSMTGDAAALREEQQASALLVVAERVVVATEIPV